MQAFGLIRRKEIILTDAPNTGLLTEMSMAELKERLFILRVELKDELERKKALIKYKKECRKEIVQSYMELIESHKLIT